MAIDRRGWWAALLLVLLPAAATAHDVRPGAVALREVEADVFAARITRPRGPSGPPIDPRPIWPADCAPTADGRLRCPGGLRGELALPGLRGADVECLVAVQWRDGRRFEALIGGDAPQVDIRPPAAPPSRLTGWLQSGVEHIVFGPDHLLFVLGLALVVRRRRALIVAISGFTLAHSLTLTAAALGWMPPAGRAVELLIAASVLLLAVEATRPPERGPPPTARSPLLVVLPFGLLHGLGFAGPLLGLGLPADGALWALVGFNLGVELGQLAALAITLLLLTHAPRIRQPAAWATGVIAAYWTLDRAVEWSAAWAI